jgi:hypothetical protein
LNRRNFLKYAGATGAVVGASALGLNYVLSSRPSITNQATTTTSLNQITSAPKTNSPPRFLWPPLNVKPKYILPTPQYTVELSPNAVDDDNDPLSFTWSVDGKEVSHDNNCSAKLAEGDHEIDVTASDGQATVSSKSTLTVEPDQIYPTKPLKIRYKGVRYPAGAWAPYAASPTPGLDEMDEQLDTILEELGCNAILAYAGTGYEDNLIECGKLAIEKGFDRIYIEPEYMDSTIDETIENITRFVPKIETLRKMSDSIVFVVGHEFGLETSGIIPGDTWWDRMAYQLDHADWQAKVNSNLPRLFSKLLPVIKEKYPNGRIAYAAAIWEVELVPWGDPVFESVCTDAYVMDKFGITEDWILNHLSRLKRYGKPVYSSEAGCMTYSGASHWGGAMPLNVWDKGAYDEDEQADYIRRYCEMLNRAKIEGYFYTLYNDNPGFDKGYGLWSTKA